jgi:hypothetical protein
LDHERDQGLADQLGRRDPERAGGVSDVQPVLVRDADARETKRWSLAADGSTWRSNPDPCGIGWSEMGMRALRSCQYEPASFATRTDSRTLAGITTVPEAPGSDPGVEEAKPSEARTH